MTEHLVAWFESATKATMAAPLVLVPLFALQAGTKPSADRPVTIEVLKDVSLEPFDTSKEHLKGLLLFFNEQKPVVIRRGQTFQMIRPWGQMEGGCLVRYQRKEYEISSCFWQEGFRDHQTDFFVVKK